MFSACRIDELADGRYIVNRIYIDGQRVGDGHRVFETLPLASANWFIDTGDRSAVFVQSGNQTHMDIRVRDGYLEQRGDHTDNNWTREDGTIGSSFVSTRVEGGWIVIRFMTGSMTANEFDGRVYVFFSPARTNGYLVPG